MQYSPKLKAAMAKIKLLLEKEDIGGSVILHTPGHSEYLLHINPSYSCAKFEGDAVRVRAKLSDFNGNKELQNKKIEDTVNMITHFAEICGQNSLQFFDLIDVIKNHVEIQNDQGGHSSHTTQNN